LLLNNRRKQILLEKIVQGKKRVFFQERKEKMQHEFLKEMICYCCRYLGDSNGRDNDRSNRISGYLEHTKKQNV